MTPEPTGNAGQQTSDAGSVGLVSPHAVIERPPPGLARGRYAWPAWAVLLVGVLAVFGGLGYLVWRLRGRGRT